MARKTAAEKKTISFLDKLRATVAAGAQATGRKAQEAKSKFKDFLGKVQQISVRGNDIMSEQSRLRSEMRPLYLGKLVMYYYDPKWKKELKYYDRFPLIIPLEIYKDGWLGANLHYLPPGYRAVLMDLLFKDALYQPRDKISDRKQIAMTYRKLKAIVNNNYYKPCIKRYLYSSPKGTHLKSKFYLVSPDDWDSFIFLPFERFEKKSTKVVWEDSKKIIRGEHVDMRDTNMRRNIRRRRARREARKNR